MIGYFDDEWYDIVFEDTLCKSQQKANMIAICACPRLVSSSYIICIRC